MSGASSGACLGLRLGHVCGINWGIIWGMSGASSGACLGHHLGYVWGMSGKTSRAYCQQWTTINNNPRYYMHLWCRFYGINLSWNPFPKVATVDLAIPRFALPALRTHVRRISSCSALSLEVQLLQQQVISQTSITVLGGFKNKRTKLKGAFWNSIFLVIRSSFFVFDLARWP